MFLSTSLPSAPSWRSLTWAVKLPWSAWCRRGGEEAGLVNSSPRRMKCWVCTPEQGQHALEGFPSTDKAIVGKGVFPLFTRMVVKSPFYAGWIRCCLQRCLVAASWETGQWKDAKLVPAALQALCGCPGTSASALRNFNKYHFKLTVVLSAVKEIYWGASFLWWMSKAELLLVYSSQRLLSWGTYSVWKSCIARRKKKKIS